MFIHKNIELLSFQEIILRLIYLINQALRKKEGNKCTEL